MANLSIRIPDDIHQQAKAAAEADRRSLNQEIIWLLEAGLQARALQQPGTQP